MGGKTAVLGLAAVLVLGGCSDGTDAASPTTTTVAPASPTTLSQPHPDKQKAQRIVLTAADMPGYAQDPPGRSLKSSPEFITAAGACVNNNPVIAALRTDNDPRGARSADFRKGQPVTVSSSVTFAETEDQARSALADIGAASFPACFARALTPEVRNVPTNSNVSVTATELPDIAAGDQSLGYRAVARYRTEGTNVTAYLDFTFVRVGRSVASIDNVWTTAFPAAERLRLATLIASRMTAP